MIDFDKTVEDIKAVILNAVNYDFKLAKYIAYCVNNEMEQAAAMHAVVKTFEKSKE